MDNTKKRLSNILHQLAEIDYVHPEDIPNIDLYMDQIWKLQLVMVLMIFI